MNNVIKLAYEYGKHFTHLGETANYIPELEKADINDLGVYLIGLDGQEYGVGSYEKKFTIQSISKVLVLTLALMDNGPDKVFDKIGVEATGDPFNSIVRLEVKNLQKPLNPMINAGAIATTSLVLGENKQEKINRIMAFTRVASGNSTIEINEEVYASESKTGDRNRSLAYFMKSCGTIEGDVEELVDIYFRQCAMEMTCKDLARIGTLYANKGVSPITGEQIIPTEICRIVMGIMMTCGLYDASGEFAVNVGIPSKSGVGGGILSPVPGKMGIGVYGPALDQKGNTIGGIEILKYLSKELNLNIFS
ncbi:MAG: glutaminase A [Cellulosilyticaceae bacterium]